MDDPTDRDWWDEEGRCPEWPESLKDEMHAAWTAGYELGMKSIQK